MREKLLQELYMYINSKGAADELTKSELTIILGNYEIDSRNTEIIDYNFEDYNQRLIKEFLVNKTVAGLTEKTVKHYQGRLLSILGRISKPVGSITSNDLKMYIANRQIADKVSVTTLINDYRVLSSFFGWLLTEEYIDKNPMLKVVCPKHRKIKKKAFSSLECEQLRNACSTLRDKAIVETLLSTWCRISELTSINIEDIQGNAIKVIGKGKKERIVYLNAKAMLAINNYLMTRTDNNPALFVSTKAPYQRITNDGVRRMLNGLSRTSKVENVHPHRFRRTGATLALKHGMNIETVSYLLGHDSISTTQIYLDIEEDTAAMAHTKYVA